MKRFAALSLAAVLLGSTAACSTSGGVTTLNTAELSNDASAIAYAVQAIEDMPSVSANLSAADKAKFNSLVAEIRALTAQIAANSSGSISVNTGRDWAKSLGQDFSELLSIATPIVSQFAPSASGYLGTASQLIPLIEALTGLSAEAHTTPESAAQIRARVYLGA